MRHAALPTLLLAALAVPVRAQCELDTLVGTGPALDQFGIEVSISASGRTIAVGAAVDGVAVPGSGAVYVYERIGAGFVETAKLASATAASGDSFGIAVAAADAALVVGARYDDVVPFSGTAFVFEKDAAGAWVQVAELEQQNPLLADGFGRSVAVSAAGDVAFVGARGKFGNAGRVLVFVRTAAGWAFDQTLAASDASTGAKFGFPLAAGGDDFLLVGAPEKEERTGAAYLFGRTPSGYVEVALLAASDAETGDRFGRALSLSPDGQRLLIGAIDDVVAGVATGSAYIFGQVGSTWVEREKLLPADGASGDEFGRTAALFGDVALVGARNHDGAGLDAGSAYVFEEVGAAWVPTARFTAADTAAGDQLGWTVALSASTAVVGAPALGNAPGRAYLFDLPAGRALVGCPLALSAATGGSQTLILAAGPALAARLYLVLTSASGSAPGLAIDGVLLPLNADPVLTLALVAANSATFANTLGVLDAAGSAAAALSLPALPAAAGVQLQSAYLVFDPTGAAVLASNAVALGLE